jgi:hypothetical protein
MSHIPATNKPSLLELMKTAVEVHQSLGARPPDAAAPVRKATLPMSNNNGAPAPELVLLKRATPDPQEGSSMTFSQMLKAAVTSLEAGDLDTAERYLNRCTIMQKGDVHIHNYGNGIDDDDDEDADNGTTVEDTWSEAADAKAKGKNASLKRAKNNSDGEDDGDDDEDDPSYTRKIAKWSHDYNLPHYGGTPSPTQPSSLGAEGPSQRADTYQLSVTPTVGQPARTSFDSYVDQIAERDKVTRPVAMSRARIEQPKAYEDFQQFASEEPTSAQHMRRDRGMTTKAAPTTYEDLVSAQMAKGVTEEVAAQRVMQQHGSFALRNRMIAKRGPSITRTFAKGAAQIMQADGVDRCEALRRLRKERPDWYDALNAS